MYSPENFGVTDPAVLADFMKQHSFATILTHDGKVPHGTHMPVLLDETRGLHGTLVSHMARANPQWRHFENGEEILVIFQGPHAYVSPAWYVTTPAVPTWNYTAVHVYGIPRIVTDHHRFAEILHDLIEFYEAPRADRWHGVMPEDFRDQLMRAIVGIEIEITRIEGKFKLSQNRPADLPGVIAALEASPDQMDRETAALMRKERPR
jgi:transcriptional regulator